MTRYGMRIALLVLGVGLSGTRAPVSAQLFGLGTAMGAASPATAGRSEVAVQAARIPVADPRSLALAFARQYLAEAFQTYYDGPNRKIEASFICELIRRNANHPGAQALLTEVAATQGDLQAYDWYRSHRRALDRGQARAHERLLGTTGTLEQMDHMQMMSDDAYPARHRDMVYDAKRFVDDYLRPTFPELEGAPFDNR